MSRRVMLPAPSSLYLTALAGAAPSTSPVADAAMRGDIGTRVRALLKQGADVNAAQGDGMTALHWAAERGDAALADMLLYAGANVERGDPHRPVHAAAPCEQGGQRRRRPGAAQGGRERRPRRRPTPASTALHFAAASGQRGGGHGAARPRRRRERQGIGVGADAADVRGRAEPRRRRLRRCSRAVRIRASRRRPIDVASQLAMDRAAHRPRSEDSRSVGAEGAAADAEPGARRRVQAARELYASGKIAAAREGAGGRERGRTPPTTSTPKRSTRRSPARAA